MSETPPLTLVLCLEESSHSCMCKTQAPYHPMVLARAPVGSLRPHSIPDLPPRAPCHRPTYLGPGTAAGAAPERSGPRRWAARRRRPWLRREGRRETRTSSRCTRGLGAPGQGRRQAGAPYIPAGAGPNGWAQSQRATGQAVSRNATKPRTPAPVPLSHRHPRRRSTGAPSLGCKATDARDAGATDGRRGQGKGWGDGLPGPSSGFSPLFPSRPAWLEHCSLSPLSAPR